VEKRERERLGERGRERERESERVRERRSERGERGRESPCVDLGRYPSPPPPSLHIAAPRAPLPDPLPMFF